MVGSSGGKMNVNSGKWPCAWSCCLLPRPMGGTGVTPIFSYLENYQFHHTRLESLKHLIFVPFYIILVF